MSKMLQFNETALKSILKGVKTLARVVTVTLGPKGRNVMINKGFGSPLSTKDGVTVAKEIALKDKFENIGAQLVKEAASKTSDLAGDGTTTAIVLAAAIFKEGVKNVIAGANPMSVKRGIDKAVQCMVEALDKLSTPVSKSEEIKQVATISSNNDPEVGEMVANAMDKVGKDGTITLADAKGIETVLDVVEGMQFDKGYLSPYFVTNAEKMSVELSNARVLVIDKKVSNAKELVPILEKVMEEGQNPLLIIAEDIDGEALATLVINKLKGGMPLCAVKAPAFGDRRKAVMQDIAILTGATVVTEEVGLSLDEVGLEVLGTVKTIKVGKEETTLVGGEGNPDLVKERIAQIRAEMDETTSDYDRKNLEERLAKLAGGVAVINVGAATETEMKEKKARVEDALHATRAAVVDGIVPGGGVALLRAVKALDNLKLEGDEKIGVAIIRRAAFAPAIAIATNCGKEGNMVAQKVFEAEGAFGYNGLKDCFEDLLKAGVIDPVLVTKSALKHAASIASLLITVACMITDKPEPKKASPMDGAGGMGGMPGMGGMGGMG
ncbi:MAG: 60 kDa chaperonin, partial [Chlamydiae bacterium]|nr:60 kDa chaperonin [Chlamydiota bacterium]